MRIIRSFGAEGEEEALVVAHNRSQVQRHSSFTREKESKRERERERKEAGEFLKKMEGGIRRRYRKHILHIIEWENE